MSAPDTNLARQRRRHAFVLGGMALVVVFGVLIILYWLFEEVAASDPPEPPAETGTAPDTAPPQVIGPDVPKGLPGTTTAPPAPQPTPQQTTPQD